MWATTGSLSYLHLGYYADLLAEKTDSWGDVDHENVTRMGERTTSADYVPPMSRRFFAPTRAILASLTRM